MKISRTQRDPSESKSRLELRQEIINLHDSLNTRQSKSLFHVTMMSLFLFNSFFLSLRSSLFNPINSPIQSFCHDLVEHALLQERNSTLDRYQALRDFKFPAYCNREYSVAPWQPLSALSENDQRHFLFEFSRAVDRCVKSTSVDTTVVRETFELLYKAFTPLKEQIPFKDQDWGFYTQAKELAKNFLTYKAERDQVYLENLKNHTRSFHSGVHALIAILFSMATHPPITKIFWRLYNRRENTLFSIPLHYQSTEKLLTLKEKLHKKIQLKIATSRSDDLLRKIIKFIQIFFFIIILLFIIHTSINSSTNLNILRLPLLVGLFAYSFKFSDFNFSFLLPDEKKVVSVQLSILKKALTDTKNLTKIVKIEPLNLGKKSSSYLLLTPNPAEILPPGMVATILQKSLQNARVTFLAEGKEVAIFSNTKFSNNQQREFKKVFLELFTRGFSINKLKKQFFKLTKCLNAYSQINDVRIEEGFLSHSEPESKIYIYSDMPKVLQVISRVLNEDKFSVEPGTNQIILSCRQSLPEQRFLALLKNIKSALAPFQNVGEATLPPSLPPKQKKTRSRAPEAKVEEEEVKPHSAPPPPLKIVWDQHTIYPHPDIQPVQGAIKRFMKFDLPAVCFDNDKELRNHFKSKSTQMAREKDDQGVKHSTYTGYNFFTKKRESFNANVKVLGSNSNNRVLVRIERAPAGGEILYRACAFERNVH